MRALMQVALAAAASMGVNIAEQIQGGIENPQGPPVGATGRHGKRKFMSAEHYAKHDPYYGISGRGRRGARQRMQQQYDRCARGKLNDKGGRDLSGPPFISKNRNNVFLAAIGAGMSRNEAMKQARRAPAKQSADAGRPVPAHRSGPGYPLPTVNPPHRSGAAA